MLRCAVTDASRFVDAVTRRARLVADAARWAQQGVDFIQLREKTIAAGELYDLAVAIMHVLRAHGRHTKLLINGRADVALAACADGVHLSSHAEELTPQDVRQLFANAERPAPLLSVSCHTLDDVQRADRAHVDLILFGPVFEKRVQGMLLHEGCGLDALAEACAATSSSLLALGGVDEANAEACVAASASGIAAIRAFAAR